MKEIKRGEEEEERMTDGKESLLILLQPYLCASCSCTYTRELAPGSFAFYSLQLCSRIAEYRYCIYMRRMYIMVCENHDSILYSVIKKCEGNILRAHPDTLVDYSLSVSIPCFSTGALKPEMPFISLYFMDDNLGQSYPPKASAIPKGFR